MPSASPARSVTPSAPLELALRAALDAEREWAAGGHGGMTKERFIRERLGLTPARFQHELQRALDHPAALAYDPALVRRLLRLRERRRRRLRGPGPWTLE